VSTQPPPVAYQIDFADRVYIVNRASFDAFAAENGQPALASRVHGTPLWHHIHGAEVSAIYRALIKTCRMDRCPRSFPFRCDAPGIERHMTMRMWSPDGRRVEFVTFVEHEVTRAPIALLDVAAPRDDRVIVICAWCHAVAVHYVWVPLETAVGMLGLFGSAPIPMLSHGVCPECATTFMQLRPP